MFSLMFLPLCPFFFFNDTATTEIYTSFPTRRSSDLRRPGRRDAGIGGRRASARARGRAARRDRKSTRLNSSHGYISYAVFCLKKKKNKNNLDVTAVKRVRALVVKALPIDRMRGNEFA